MSQKSHQSPNKNDQIFSAKNLKNHFNQIKIKKTYSDDVSQGLMKEKSIKISSVHVLNVF
jgi:hypothetical protein